MQSRFWLFLLLILIPTMSVAYTTDHLARELGALFPKASGTVLSSLGATTTVRITEGEVRSGQYLRVYAVGEAIRHPLTDEYLGQRESLVGLVQLTRQSMGNDWLARRVASNQELRNGMRIRSGERGVKLLYLGEAHSSLNQEMELSLAKTGTFELVNTLHVERTKQELGITELTPETFPKLTRRLNVDVVLDLSEHRTGGTQSLLYKLIDGASFLTLAEGDFALREFYTEQVTSADSAEAAILGAWQTRRIDPNFRVFDPIDINNDGIPEMALLGDGTVALVSLEQGEMKILSQDRSASGAPLSIVAADMDGDGVQEIYASVFDGKRIYTLQYHILSQGIARQKTFFDVVIYRTYLENGTSEILLQKVAPTELMGGSIHRFTLQGGEIVTTEELSKRNVELVGAARVGDQWLNYTADGRIALFDNSYRQLGATPADFGAFLVPMVLSDDIRLYAKRRVLPIVAGGTPYIVGMNNEPFLGFLSVATAFKGSDLRLLQQSGASFHEVYRSVYISRAVMSDAAFVDVNGDGRREIAVLMNYRNRAGAPTGGTAFLFFQIDSIVETAR
ncbi:FG-GAP repeat domain-containing protein [Chrysiogenes arsenatis]|uniref:FG-GAP repeat domain-containing protein n=1 Tax=Chrysiogenes arsenatis TaxID=309797 RepID=UPI000413B634|nr:VCBS repeat-containing protein [Chrysiogenes arsenatis]